MATDADGLARYAALLADPTRAAICLALLDGRAWTGRELAAQVGVAASTASEQLSRLVDGGVLRERRQGRHRYVELADAATAEIVELLGGHAGGGHAPRPRSLRASRTAEALARGRTCYDHLAGRLGVRITEAMVGRGYLDADAGLALTAAGRAWLQDEVGVPAEALRTSRRPLTRACLDFTERRTHLAGLAGARLRERLLTREWLHRIPGGRAVRPTPAGRRALAALLGLTELE